MAPPPNTTSAPRSAARASAPSPRRRPRRCRRWQPARGGGGSAWSGSGARPHAHPHSRRHHRGARARGALAGRAASRDAVARRPHAPRRAVPVRIGGFGGAEGLARYLGARTIDAVVDATHPFAGDLAQRRAAAARAGVPLLALARPPWRKAPATAGSRSPMAAARRSGAGAAPGVPRRSAGTSSPPSRPRRSTATWSAASSRRAAAACRRPKVHLGRGPFDEADERALLAARASRSWSPRTAAARRPTARSPRRAPRPAGHHGSPAPPCRRSRPSDGAIGSLDHAPALSRGARGVDERAQARPRDHPRLARADDDEVAMSAATPGRPRQRRDRDRSSGPPDGAAEDDGRLAAGKCLAQQRRSAAPSCQGRAR